MRNTWHALISRVGIFLRALAHNPGNDTTLWVRTDGVLMYGDDPLVPDTPTPPEPVDSVLSTYTQEFGECFLDASVNSFGFYVLRSGTSILRFTNFPVGESRLVAFQGSFAIEGTSGNDPAHEYFWEGGTAPSSGGSYQMVRFTKVNETDILCMSALQLAVDAGGS